jgi:hypothetical protein
MLLPPISFPLISRNSGLVDTKTMAPKPITNVRI